jgi:hypothetical protein
VSGGTTRRKESMRERAGSKGRKKGARRERGKEGKTEKERN